jgi:hypothetical protein
MQLRSSAMAALLLGLAGTGAADAQALGTRAPTTSNSGLPQVSLPGVKSTTPAHGPVAAPATAQPVAPAPEEITVTGRTPVDTKPLPGGKDFISPMGEPFHSKDDLSGAEHWYRQADADGNGSLTLEEFKADAFRFFAFLDSDKDGDIGPIEIERYEEVIAPEVKAPNTYGLPSKVKVDNDGNVTPAPYPDRLGAGRFGYLPLPEPVVYADTNMDRGVSKLEFSQAAEKRFKMLDVNGDGGITRDELPKPGGR